MGALIATQDWSATPLGPIECWPQSLRTTLSVILNSRLPHHLVWGPELTSFYNDAYRPLLGAKPEALGRAFRQVWAEVWGDVEPLVQEALSGRAVFREDLPLTLERYGYPEEAYFTLCYSPVRDETGQVAGLSCTVMETTAKVLSDRRQAFRLSLEERLRGLADPINIVTAAAEMIGQHTNTSRAGYGEIDQSGEIVSVARDWTRDTTIPSLAGEARILDAFGPAVIGELRAGRTLVVKDCLTDLRSAGEAYAVTWASIGCRSLIVVPLIKEGRFRAMLYLHEPAPRRWSEAEAVLARDVAERTWDAVERGRAEAELHRSEARRSAALAAAQLGTFEWNLITDAVALDARSREIFGFAPGEGGCAQEVFDRIHTDDIVRVRAEARASADALSRLETEYRICRPDGEVRTLASLSDAVPGSDGKAERALGVFADVSERKAAEAALRQSAAEAVFHAALSDALRPLARPAEIQAEASRVLGDHLGASRVHYVEIEPDGEHAVVPADYAPAVPNRLGRYRLTEFATLIAECRAGRNFVVSDLAADPRLSAAEKAMFASLPVSAIVVVPLAKDGRLVALLAVHHVMPHTWTPGEIGSVEETAERTWAAIERARAERALRESEERFRELADNVSQLVWTADPSGWIYWYNKRWYDYTGTTLAQMQGWGWRDVHHPDHIGQIIAEVQSKWAGGEAWEGTYLLRSAQGEYRWFLTRAEPIRDKAGELVRWFGTNTDITDQKRAEEHQRLLINELNHRVKNTLTTVQSIASQTLRNASSLGEARQAFEERLFALSRAHDVLTRENWDGADLYEIVAQAVEPYSNRGEDRLHLGGPHVRLPPRMALALAMALQELATNAVKYGALSNTIGEIRISWTVDGTSDLARLRLQWREAAGPPVQAPTRRGFGTRLIERSLAQDLDGSVHIDFPPTGIICTVDAPLHRS